MKKALIILILVSVSQHIFAQKHKKKTVKNVETINLAVGKSTILRFKSLSTAGYTWTFEQGKKGLLSVEQIENQEKPTKQDTPIVGVSADELFKLTAIAKGEEQLTFVQKRVWEKDTPPAQTKIYLVKIK